MKRSMNLATLVLAAAAFSATNLAAQTVTVKEETPGLLKKATISATAATATALAKVPKGAIQAAEIENEDGKLIYSFDIKVAGKSGIEEVAVDAKTGLVLSVEHETPADEKKEAAADKAKAAKAKADSLKMGKMKKPPVF